MVVGSVCGVSAGAGVEDDGDVEAGEELDEPLGAVDPVDALQTVTAWVRSAVACRWSASASCWSATRVAWACCTCLPAAETASLGAPPEAPAPPPVPAALVVAVVVAAVVVVAVWLASSAVSLAWAVATSDCAAVTAAFSEVVSSWASVSPAVTV